MRMNISFTPRPAMEEWVTVAVAFIKINLKLLRKQRAIIILIIYNLLLIHSTCTHFSTFLLSNTLRCLPAPLCPDYYQFRSHIGILIYFIFDI